MGNAGRAYFGRALFAFSTGEWPKATRSALDKALKLHSIAQNANCQLSQREAQREPSERLQGRYGRQPALGLFIVFYPARATIER